MARKPRNAPGNIIYHVMNRTWGRHDLFDDDADYAAFEHVLAQALQRDPTMQLRSYGLMPNHFRLLLWPAKDRTLARFMQWVAMRRSRPSGAPGVATGGGGEC